MGRRERRVFGSVRRLSSGRWQVRYRDLTGMLHSGPHTFTDQLSPSTVAKAYRLLSRILGAAVEAASCFVTLAP
jgi:hypothetical protein